MNAMDTTLKGNKGSRHLAYKVYSTHCTMRFRNDTPSFFSYQSSN